MVNLEMQMLNQQNWCERSLIYLCRTFDQLNHGEAYDTVKPAIHIGFLNFTLFEDFPEFYASYKLMNVKNYHLYSDKFILSVVDLKQIELATEEDKAYGIDYWADLFKATTWEELKMIAKKNNYLAEASTALYKMNADEAIRERCQAREDYFRIQNTMKHKMEALTAENVQITAKYEQMTSQYKQMASQYKQMASQYEQMASHNNSLLEEIERLRAELAASLL